MSDLRRGLLNFCLFFQEKCYLTQGITEVSGREFRNPLFTHFRSVQASSLSYEDHGDEPHNFKECCVEQLVPQCLGRITYYIGTNNT